MCQGLVLSSGVEQRTRHRRSLVSYHLGEPSSRFIKLKKQKQKNLCYGESKTIRWLRKRWNILFWNSVLRNTTNKMYYVFLMSTEQKGKITLLNSKWTYRMTVLKFVCKLKSLKLPLSPKILQNNPQKRKLRSLSPNWGSTDLWILNLTINSLCKFE